MRSRSLCMSVGVGGNVDLLLTEKKRGFVYFGWISNERVPSSWLVGSGLVGGKRKVASSKLQCR